MKYSEKDFDIKRLIRKLDAEFILQLLLLEKLPPSMQTILDAEIKAGNRIVDVMEDYPDPHSVCVTLGEKFIVKHKNLDEGEVEFSLCNDPHYWFADYTSKTYPKHLIIC